MNQKYNLFLILIIFFLTISQTYSYNLCDQMKGQGCEQDSCINKICYKCAEQGKDVNSDCACNIGEYWNDLIGNPACAACNKGCATCYGPNENDCLSCKEGLEGWVLNVKDDICQCAEGYAPTGDESAPCQRCYQFGNECFIKCPGDLITNNQFWTCEAAPPKDLENNDDTVWTIVMVVLAVLVIILTILLFNYFASLLKRFYDSDKIRCQPLTDEESFYLANEKEIERKLEIERQEREEQLQRELEEKRLEQERIKKEQEEAERRKLEEEEQRRKAEEEALRKFEEEQEQKRIEQERLREQARQEQLERERREQEERERIAREEAERERVRREREEQLRREEEEKLRLEQAEREKNRIRELARQAREKRKMERQMTRQSTMAANQAKLEAMRQKRQSLIDQKTQLEDLQKSELSQAEDIDNQFSSIKERMEQQKIRRQETLNLKNIIFQKQATFATQKQELSSALEGIDFSEALRAVKDITVEDIVFLQNLRTPPQRIQLCLEATVMLLSGSAKTKSWDDIKKDISNSEFRKGMVSYDPEQMSDKVFKKVRKEYTSDPQWNLGKMQKASPAAGAFAKWVDACIKYKQIKVDNKELFEKVKIMKKEEEVLQAELDKVEELEQQEEEFLKEESQLSDQQDSLKAKQAQLQQQATLKDGEISEKSDAIKQLNTGDISLEEIQESEEDCDTDEDPEVQRQLAELGL